MAGQPKKPPHPAAPSYDVGKYKPPVEHRFKPGNKGGGRKKGSKNKDRLEDLLDQKVVIGHDSIGRPIRKTWRKVIDLQLLKKAAEGDLAAIKLVKEFELKLAAIRARYDPPKSEADIRAELEQEERRKQNTAKFIKLLDDMKDFRFTGIGAENEADRHPLDKHHRLGVAAWVYDALMDYREKLGEPREPELGYNWRPVAIQGNGDEEGGF